MRLDDSDRARIAAAVKAAEAATDGEIVVIAADRSDSYHDVALHWATLGMFLVLAVIAAIPGHGVPLLDSLLGGDHWTSSWSSGFLLTALLVLLAVTFLLLRFAFYSLPVKMLLTPTGTKARRVRRRAIALFRASIEARTATRTGALLYVSVAERRAEIVTDATIHAAVPAEAWGDAMAALIDAIRDGRAGDGIVAAIEAIGRVLAAHFPYTGTDPNELPDRLIEL